LSCRSSPWRAPGRAPTLDRAVTKARHWRVGDVVRHAIAIAVSRLDDHEPALWTERDPEAVHQARVATRRLRSDLGTLHDFVDETWAKPLRAELRWFGAELGQVRDVEVLHERLALHAALLPDTEAEAARRAIRRLDADHMRARTELLRTLREPRYAQLHRALHDAVRDPKLAPAASLRATDALPGAVRPIWRKLRRAVDALGPAPSDAALHQVRIRAKRCRYAAEVGPSHDTTRGPCRFRQPPRRARNHPAAAVEGQGAGDRARRRRMVATQ